MSKNFYISLAITVLCAIFSLALLPILNKKIKPGEKDLLAYWNSVEKTFLQKSGRSEIYKGENLPVIEVDSMQALDKLAALSFLHWIENHPEGVIALAAGKSMRGFVEQLRYYRHHWTDPEIAAELRMYEITGSRFPDTSRLRFVQIEELYPIDAKSQVAYAAYIREQYLDFLGITPENALLMDVSHVGILGKKGGERIFPPGEVMDLSLLDRNPTNGQEEMQKQALQEAVAFCARYEETLRSWGGIGFFMGNLGFIGQIACNMPGCPHDGTTRLVGFDYMAAAAIAIDLGGIEHLRDKAILTIGLGSIAFNRDATVILLGTGEVKAQVAADAIQQKKNEEYPATVFHDLKGARLYLTRGAASELEARKLADIQKRRFHQMDKAEIDEIVIELALGENVRIVDLTKADFLRYPKSALLFRKYRSNLRDLLNDVRSRLIAKLEKGLTLPEGETIVHTGPHHDDIMLAYHPLIRPLLKKDQNYFVYLTSGFNAVTNVYMERALSRIPDYAYASYYTEIFNQDHAQLLQLFIKAAEKQDREMMEKAEALLLLQNICRMYQLDSIPQLQQKVSDLRKNHFNRRRWGEKDGADIQMLKGLVRESESERMLLMAGVPLARIYHMRTYFYDGSSSVPSISGDVEPFRHLLEKLHPQIITVAFDPEGTGPDTHYKVLQVISEALKSGNFDPQIKVWGYRNVWHRFRFSQATHMIPVAPREIQAMEETFMSCFSTQTNAAYPCPNHEGSFSQISAGIQRVQFEQLKALLGEAYFMRHANPAMRNAAGFIFIKEMGRDEFCQNAELLKARL